MMDQFSLGISSNHSDSTLRHSYDETLIDFLIINPCLWDKSDHDFRNRSLKEFKWKEVAGRMNMAAHEAIRRYKTLCERFRREMIKQSSMPNYISNWRLFNKFAALKDVQNSEERKYQVKLENAYENSDLPASTPTEVSFDTRKRKSSDSPTNEHNDNGISEGEVNFQKFARLFDDQSINGETDTNQRMHVEPSFIGGSADLSTDAIAAFCQFLETSLKQMTTDRSDELIEDISMLLFKKKREFKAADRPSRTSSPSTN